MAEYVIQDETMETIADAIRSKKGKSGLIPTTSMAAEILSIESAPAVQTKTGSFTTDSSGFTSVNCGFKPDYVIIQCGYYDNSPSVIGVMFTESKNTKLVFFMPSPDSEYACYYGHISQLYNGFSVDMGKISTHGYTAICPNMTLSYTAVKNA